MFGPKHTAAGSAPSSWPTTDRARSSWPSHSTHASNGPPPAAVLPLAIHALTAWIAVSTICVPAGASNRDQPLARPGKRCLSEGELTCAGGASAALRGLREALGRAPDRLDVALVEVAELGAVDELDAVAL